MAGNVPNLGVGEHRALHIAERDKHQCHCDGLIQPQQETCPWADSAECSTCQTHPGSLKTSGQRLENLPLHGVVVSLFCKIWCFPLLQTATAVAALAAPQGLMQPEMRPCEPKGLVQAEMRPAPQVLLQPEGPWNPHPALILHGLVQLAGRCEP